MKANVLNICGLLMVLLAIGCSSLPQPNAKEWPNQVSVIELPNSTDPSKEINVDLKRDCLSAIVVEGTRKSDINAEPAKVSLLSLSDGVLHPLANVSGWNLVAKAENDAFLYCRSKDDSHDIEFAVRSQSLNADSVVKTLVVSDHLSWAFVRDSGGMFLVWKPDSKSNPIGEGVLTVFSSSLVSLGHRHFDSLEPLIPTGELFPERVGDCIYINNAKFDIKSRTWSDTQDHFGFPHELTGSLSNTPYCVLPSRHVVYYQMGKFYELNPLTAQRKEFAEWQAQDVVKRIVASEDGKRIVAVTDRRLLLLYSPTELGSSNE